MYRRGSALSICTTLISGYPTHISCFMARSASNMSRANPACARDGARPSVGSEAELLGLQGEINVQGEDQKKLDVARLMEWPRLDGRWSGVKLRRTWGFFSR